MYFQVDPYDLISFLLESLLYGAFLVLFLLSTVLLVHRRCILLREKSREPSRLRSLTFYLIMGGLMFCTITAKWSFYWPEVLPIHASENALQPQIPRLSRTAYRFKEACIQATVLLGDSIIIYRLFILTNRSKMMIVPPIGGLLAFIGCAICLSGPLNDTLRTPVPVRNGTIKLTRWDVAATALTLGITIYSTAVISWILLRAQSRSGIRLGGHGLKKALTVVVESAAISATWNLLFFIAGLGFRSQLALTLLDGLPAVYGISTMLINVRVGLGFARGAGGAHIVRADGIHDQRAGPSTMIFTTRVSTGVTEVGVELDERSVRSSVTATSTHA